MSCEPTVIVVKEQTVKILSSEGLYNNSQDVIQKTASSYIAQFSVVKADTSNNVSMADNTNLADARVVLGVALNSAGTGENVLIRTFGEIVDTGFSWTQGAWIYLSTAGNLTQTPPTSGFSLIIGQALSATDMRVFQLQPIFL